MAWFDAEAPVLLALIDYASANGFDAHAWQLPWALGPFFNLRGQWRTSAACQQPALAAARRLGDAAALAHAYYLLGNAQGHLEEYQAAGQNMRYALDLFRDLGDRANEGMVLNGLASMLETQGRYTDALVVALDALRMLKAAGHWWTQANLENGVGWLYAHLGQYDQALEHCQQALTLHRESGNRGGAADTLDSLGFAYLHLGDLARARPTTSRPSTPSTRSAGRSARAARWPGWATSWPRWATCERPGPVTCGPPRSSTPCRTRYP